MTEATIDVAAGAVRVRFPDGADAAYPFLWLRDNCPTALDARTGERVFDLLSAPPDLAPESVSAEDGRVLVRWRGRAHVSAFAEDWLAARRPGRPQADPAAVIPSPWRGDLDPATLPRLDAARADDPAALRDWMIGLKRCGAALVEGLADDREAGVGFVRRIGHLRETWYGVEFDVVSRADGPSIADTAVALTPHTDLPYQPHPPAFQFLHCLRNDAEGGGSTLADGFAIAEALREEDPEAHRLLAECEIPWRSRSGVVDIRRRAPVIRLGPDGAAAEVRWSIAQAEAFDLPAETLPAYYRAYRRFMEMTRSGAFEVAFRLSPGEMLAFDNRRMLHGREAFDPSTGSRILRGCYLDDCAFDSRLRLLSAG